VLFEERNQVSPQAVIKLIQKQARDYRMDGPLRLRIQQELDTPLQRFEYANRLLSLLGGNEREPAPVPANAAAPKRDSADKLR
jgi:transcription-repair coupling factor (superfamily II helicase)